MVYPPTGLGVRRSYTRWSKRPRINKHPKLKHVQILETHLTGAQGLRQVSYDAIPLLHPCRLSKSPNRRKRIKPVWADVR